MLADFGELVVIPRPGEVPAVLPPVYRLRLLRGWPLSESPSEVRRRVTVDQSVRHLVPPGVAEAIAAGGNLYRP